MAKTEHDPVALFKAYIANRKVLIADPSRTSRNALLKIMGTLGAPPNHVLRAETYQEAFDMIKNEKPHVVICEYDLGPRCGLELLQTFREQFPETKECVFTLLTSNNSQSAITQAAEEDVDAFILKPYSQDTLTRNLLRAALAKVNPPDYLKAIERGKTFLFDKKFDEALNEFKNAELLDPKPALASFYIGQTELMKTLLDEAESSFKKGLTFNKIHYKCMVGLYELLMQKKLYADAYDVVRRMSRLFPANPKRLASVLRLAIMNKNYDDIERYYQLFTGIDHREEELIQYICASLVVCGKYYLRSNYPNRGIELFEKAAISAAGRAKFLKEIILGLCEFGLHKEARSTLRRFSSEQQGTAEYLSLRYLIDTFDHGPAEIYAIGNQLLRDGHADPILYRVILKNLHDQNQPDKIENIMMDALSKFPEQKEAFEKAKSGKMF